MVSSDTSAKPEKTKLNPADDTRDFALRTSEGRILTIEKTAQSTKLLVTKNIGKTIEVVGKVNEDTNSIEVTRFKLVQHKQNKPTEKTSKSGTALYTCPMHPEVKSDKPGDCPKCGMKLVKKS